MAIKQRTKPVPNLEGIKRKMVVTEQQGQKKLSEQKEKVFNTCLKSWSFLY